MSGIGKQFVWQDYLTAYNIAWDNGISSIDEPVLINNHQSGLSMKAGDLLTDDYPSPENIAIKKDLFEKMSNEAKEVINIIFNSPQEILDSITTDTYDKISKLKIKAFLINAGWTKKKVTKCFKEIEDLTKTF